MNAIVFDTHASFKRLKDAGLNAPRRADLSAKSEIVGVESRLDAKIVALDSRLTALKGELV